MAKEKGSLVIDHSSRPTETTQAEQVQLPQLPIVSTDSSPLFAGFSAISAEDSKAEDFVVVNDE